MMRVICLLLVSVIAIKLNAQQYTKFNGYGFQADRLKADSISIHPSDTVRNKAARSIAVLNGVFYIADGTKWKVVGTDTTSLSNRIDARVKYTDTATMLSPYLRKADTTTLSNRINLKLNISDTATMLSPYSKLKSVGLSMPSAFNVANSPLTSDGTIAVSGAGTAAQYVRGDGQLANFPSNGGGGSSVNYYLNGSVNQGTFGGDTYYEMSKVPIIGAGTNFIRTNAQGNGYIASFITDAGDPALLNIPGGNWNLEFYFNASSGGSTPSFYAEIYKVSSANVFTLIASGSTNPEGITQGTVVDQYFTSVPVPQTTILATDRIAIRIFVTTSGRTITLHTEDNNLCEILTTFSTGLNALNGLTSQVQYFATGTSGTDFAISSATDTHTFNLPTASATNRGALSSANWTTFNNKLSLSDTLTISTRAWRQKGLDSLAAIELNIADTATMLNPYARGNGTNGQVAYWNATRSLTGSSGFTFTPTSSLLLNNSVTAASAIARGQNITSTLVAAANNDVLVGLDINPTFTNGAFTGVTNLSARLLQQTGAVGGNVFRLSNNSGNANIIQFWSTNGNTLQSAIVSTNSVFGYGTYATNQINLNGGSGGIGIRTNNSAPIRFYAANADADFSNVQMQMFASTGNVVLQNGGTYTDAGFRLDVNGTARVQGQATITGAAATSATNALLVQNSANLQAIQAKNDGSVVIGNFTGSGRSINIDQNFDINYLASSHYFGWLSGGVQNFYARFNGTSAATASLQIGNGSNTAVVSAILELTSTTKGFLPPRMTTGQRDLIATPAAGLVIYNTSTNKHQGYNGTTWNDFY
jgi:hypothetical protein